MRILVISDVPWSDNNSVGNTYSNIFKNLDNAEFANLYCKSGEPDSNIPTKHYQITEKEILRDFVRVKNNNIPYSDTKKEESVRTLNMKEQKLYDLLRTFRFPLFFIARELIWKTEKWKTKDLIYFLHEFDPDIIFSFCLDSVYYADLIKYCMTHTAASTVLFFADDVYAYRRTSPLFMLHQYFVRKSIRELASHCELLYGATPELCSEYSKILHREFFPLYKICNDTPKITDSLNMPLRVTYTGNLFYGRWKVLSLLAEAIKEINIDTPKMFLNIYTSGLYNRKMTKALNINNASCLRKGITYDEVKKILKESDLVVHVESFEKKEIRKTRLSFSTKIVDCIQSGSCLLAIGPTEVASIDILRNYDIAEVITTNRKDDIKAALLRIVENNNIIIETSRRMREYGKTCHTPEYLRLNLYNKMEAIT